MALVLTLGQHLLLLVSVAVAVGALLVRRGRHRLVTLSLGGAGVAAGGGRAGVGGGAATALGVKGAVADVAARAARPGAFGRVITVQFI